MFFSFDDKGNYCNQLQDTIIFCDVENHNYDDEMSWKLSARVLADKDDMTNGAVELAEKVFCAFGGKSNDIDEDPYNYYSFDQNVLEVIEFCGKNMQNSGWDLEAITTKIEESKTEGW